MGLHRENHTKPGDSAIWGSQIDFSKIHKRLIFTGQGVYDSHWTDQPHNGCEMADPLTRQTPKKDRRVGSRNETVLLETLEIFISIERFDNIYTS